MLSICIPHYNFVNPVLFETLFFQCKSAKIDFEILIADDASIPTQKAYLKNFIQPEFRIFFLEKNIGRSAIRNFLASKAKYLHLLFLDADAEVINQSFIANYLENLGDEIVSGGRVYSTETQSASCFLHYKYGSQIEQYAENIFHSNNFLLPKNVFECLVFDEEIKNYGYEDVLFGLEAKQLGFELKKINNPVKHIQLKTNEEFVNDLEQALKNLKELITKKRNSELEQEVSVSNFYRKIRKYKLTFLLSIRQDEIFKKARALLFLNIPIGVTLLIAVYKLYYFHSLHNVKDDIRSRSF